MLGNVLKAGGSLASRDRRHRVDDAADLGDLVRRQAGELGMLLHLSLVLRTVGRDGGLIELLTIQLADTRQVALDYITLHNLVLRGGGNGAQDRLVQGHRMDGTFDTVEGFL